MTRVPEPTDLPLVDDLIAMERPTIEDYCRASAEYIRKATVVGGKKGKAAQLRLSNALAQVTLADLRDRDLGLDHAVAGEREVGGGLRSVKADVSEVSEIHGLTLAVEIKPVHLAVGRAIWNRFGDIRTFAVNIHLKFPFAVVGGILTLPTTERVRSGDDTDWKSTSHLVSRAVARFMRAGGRKTDGDAPHLLEGIAIVAFDRLTGAIEPDLPPVGSGLRWEEFINSIAEAYAARFGEV
ncbi:MAG: hypothetical protein KatS3mg011_1885 [Acidimicrobiia bacterium]|nr:MAG: hypothetical protein KatS3mg011_1885 [Acidimicrobiia bacterium]